MEFTFQVAIFTGTPDGDMTSMEVGTRGVKARPINAKETSYGRGIARGGSRAVVRRHAPRRQSSKCRIRGLIRDRLAASRTEVCSAGPAMRPAGDT
jgi:hypothetical protein